MKKRLILIPLALILFVVVVTGCGNNGESGAANEQTTVTFMTVGDPYVGAIQYLLSEFHDEHPNINVVLSQVPFLNLREMAILEFVGGSGSYDIISVDMPWIGEFVEGGHLLDLTDLVERDRDVLRPDEFLPGAWEGIAMYEGRVWTLPIAPYYMYLHYRTDVFEANNLSVPVTLDEFVDAIVTLYDPDMPLYGLSVAMRRGPSIVHDWMAYFNGFGGTTFVDHENNFRTAIDSEIGYITTRLFRDVIPYSPAGVLQYENIDRWNDFMHGNSAMVTVFNANSPMFETAEDSQVAGLVGYAHLPRLNANDPPSMPFAGFGMGINADISEEQVEAAWTFMLWMTSEEIDRRWVQVPGTPGVPLRTATVRDPELVAQFPYFQLIAEAEEAGTADGVNFRSRLPEWPMIEEILGLELNLAVSGEKEIQQALDDAAEQINELMRSRGYPVN